MAIDKPVLKEYKDRFNAKKVFLTYSDLPKGCTPQHLLKQLNAKAEVKHYLISQEMHKNGRYHLHALIEFSEKLDVKISKWFDIHFWKNRHPNVSKPRNFHAVTRYIRKDGNYISNFPNDGKATWEVLIEAENEVDFLRIYLEKVGHKLSSSVTYDLIKKLRFEYLGYRDGLERSGKLSPKEYLESLR